MIFNEFLTPDGSDIASTCRGIHVQGNHGCGAGDIRGQNWLVPGKQTKYWGIIGDRERKSVLVSLCYINPLAPELLFFFNFRTPCI